MPDTVSTIHGNSGAALHLVQQAAEAREAYAGKAETRGHGNTKTSDAFEEIGRIIEDINDVKEVRFKTPWHWQKMGIPAEVTDLRALAAQINRRKREDAFTAAQGFIDSAKRGVKDALKGVEYAEEDYRMSNGVHDGRADAAKGLAQAEKALSEARNWLKTLNDPSNDPERYARHVGNQVRSFIIVGDQIQGQILRDGYVTHHGVIPGYDGYKFAYSIDIDPSPERADAVVAAMAKLLGKNGFVFDVG